MNSARRIVVGRRTNAVARSFGAVVVAVAAVATAGAAGHVAAGAAGHVAAGAAGHVAAGAAGHVAGTTRATPSGALNSSSAVGSATPGSPSPGRPLAPSGSLSPDSDPPPEPRTVSARWRDGGAAVFTAAASAPSTMISGANDLLAAKGLLLAATDQGIARSTDGGASWRYVLTDATMWSVALAGNGFVALGRRGRPDDNGPAVVATSVDASSWALAAPAVTQQRLAPLGYGDRLAATGSGGDSVDIAVPDVVATGAEGDSLRSVDGGHTWAKTSVDLNTGIDVLPDARTMYATASTNAAACVGVVYRSTDAGAHWQSLPGSCQDRPLYAVTFIDAEHGFAAGGTPMKYGGSDVVEATDDGGRTWQVRWSRPFDANDYGGGGGGGVDDEIVRLAFTDAAHGYALTGGCTTGANGPCGGNLYATADAGHTWRATGRAGLALAASGAATVYLSGNPKDDDASLAISTDAGVHWALHTPASNLGSQAVAGGDNMLWWQTSLGIFTSSDAGDHWTPSKAAALASLPTSADPLQAAPPHDLLALDPSTATVWSSTDDGNTAHSSRLGDANDDVQAVALGPGGRAVGIVGFDDDCSSPQLTAKMASVKPGWQPETRPATMYLSSDAGGSWERAATLPFPVSLFAPGSLAVNAKLIVMIDSCGNLERSADDGRTWSTMRRPNAGSGCTVSLYGNEIWLQCPATVAHSADDGTTWTTYTTNGGGVQRLAQALGAIAPQTALVSAGGALWRTTDGGAHWTETWATLRGES